MQPYLNQTTMKNPIRILATLSAGWLLAGTAHAQMLQAQPGLLGREYVGADFTYTDYTGSRLEKARGGSAEFNQPLSAKFDAGFGYDYVRTTATNYSVNGNAVRASLLTYNHTEYGKAYFAGTLGHAWDRIKVPGAATRENGAFWAVRAGYEVPVTDRTAINAGLGYTDAFNGRTTRNETIEYRIEANHWFAPTLAGVVSGAYRQIKRLPDAGVYTIGLRWTY
jgi:hypothetical protein